MFPLNQFRLKIYPLQSSVFTKSESRTDSINLLSTIRKLFLARTMFAFNFVLGADGWGRALAANHHHKYVEAELHVSRKPPHMKYNCHGNFLWIAMSLYLYEGLLTCIRTFMKILILHFFCSVSSHFWIQTVFPIKNNDCVSRRCINCYTWLFLFPLKYVL